MGKKDQTNVATPTTVTILAETPLAQVQRGIAKFVNTYKNVKAFYSFFWDV